jgi:hypothetical protein
MDYKGLVSMFSQSIYVNSFNLLSTLNGDPGLDKIDKAGATILNLCRKIGYWACIIMAVIEIIRSLAQGDTKSIGKIIMKYSLGFGALFILPWIFDLIAEIFK